MAVRGITPAILASGFQLVALTWQRSIRSRRISRTVIATR